MAEPAAIAIDDPADPRLAPYTAMRERDLAGREGLFIVEGAVTLRTMLSPASRYRTQSLLLSPTRYAALRAILPDGTACPPIYLAGDAVMQAVAGFPIHRGVLAIGLRGPAIEPDALVPPPPHPATIVGLIGLTNHDNVGGIMRNAAAFGADALVLDAQTCDPLYRKAIRVSAGAALTVPFARIGDADGMTAFARRHDLVPLALTPGAVEELADVAVPARVLILLGTEGVGLPSTLMQAARQVRIAMTPGFDSLNVAVAGAIALHHLWVAKRSNTRDNRRQLLRAPGC